MCTENGGASAHVWSSGRTDPVQRAVLRAVSCSMPCSGVYSLLYSGCVPCYAVLCGMPNSVPRNVCGQPVIQYMIINRSSPRSISPRDMDAVQCRTDEVLIPLQFRNIPGDDRQRHKRCSLGASGAQVSLPSSYIMLGSLPPTEVRYLIESNSCYE